MKIETSPKNDLWAFREGKKEVPAAAFLNDLARTALELCSHPMDVRLGISALVRAGEFESGLADAGSPAQLSAESLTDAFADAFLGQTSALNRVPNLLSNIHLRALPEYLQISPPEGFAYYALHPHDFVRMTEELTCTANSALVIGIRSIGTTLSAIVRATLQNRGTTAARITVRPTGHPYDRVIHLNPEQRSTVQHWNSAGSDFLVVDEGPGRSGSSFLSVGETLLNMGAPQERIAFLGSRQVDGTQLCAQNGASRWSKFRFIWPRPWMYSRFGDHIYIGGGKWRDVFCSQGADFPFCWPQMERLKFLSPDRQSIFKFEGFGRFGEEVLTRADVLAKGGFGLVAKDAGDGMLCYPVMHGRTLRVTDTSTNLLAHFARYCAFRASAFGTTHAPPTQLPSMLQFNTLQEFGVDLGPEAEDLSGTAILADGRMQPQEWILSRGGDIIKVDGYTHGDDHFFPGPTDIAWDLAGIVVEWNLDETATEFLLSRFQRISGLDRRRDLSRFVLAYTVFRTAYWKMAISSVVGTEEEERVWKAYCRYREYGERLLRRMELKQALKSSEVRLQSCASQ